jgi:hypothetical protein
MISVGLQLPALNIFVQRDPEEPVECRIGQVGLVSGPFIKLVTSIDDIEIGVQVVPEIVIGPA